MLSKSVMKMSEASFNLSFIRLLPRAYNLRNFKNNNKNDFFFAICNPQGVQKYRRLGPEIVAASY